jgi:hypothetical protein
MMMIDQSFFTIIGIIFTIFSIIIITFSSTVITIIIYYWRSECRSTANLLVCNSCAGLLFYAITLSIQIPFVFQNNTLNNDEMNTRFCKIRSFIATYATLMKSYSYLVMAISCFFITILYKYRILLSFRIHWIVIITSWIFSGIITAGTFISPLANAYEPESGLCFLTTKHFATSFTVVILVFLMTLGIIIILYGIILRHITRHDQINANSESILRAKRNIKVFRKIFIFVIILSIGGTPYLLCTILHQTGQAPWPLYAVAHLFIAFSASAESIALLFTNKQVKKILFSKLCDRQVSVLNATMTVNTFRGNQIMPFHNEMQTIAILPTVN